jgi:hypothetical protein
MRGKKMPRTSALAITPVSFFFRTRGSIRSGQILPFGMVVLSMSRISIGV